MDKTYFDNNIKEKILRDVRETDSKYSKKIKFEEGWNDLEKRHSIYANKKFKPDAERWEDAITSYKCYPVFECCITSRDASGFPVLAYELENNEQIFLPADLLTNPTPIIEKYHKVFEDNKLLNAFLRVSFTAGNFSPVWYNLGNGQGNGNDTIWHKLNRYILQVDNFVGVQEQDKNKHKNLPNRKSNCQIFDVLLDSTKDKDKIIEALLFQDFFNDKKDLLQSTTIPDAREQLAKYIYTTTYCIISRGYRIYAKENPVEQLTDEDIKNIDELCMNIGLCEWVQN